MALREEVLEVGAGKALELPFGPLGLLVQIRPQQLVSAVPQKYFLHQ